jgi:hypothetical protein
VPKRINQNGIFLLGPTIMEFGTPEQKARFLPKIASSEEVWAQGWSEPNAGSDMAAIASTATVDGDHFVLRGQKTWASRGAFADWLFGLFRTDPASERHKGLTFVLVPLDAPGVTVRPIAQPTARLASPRSLRRRARAIANQLGERNKGWNVAMATAGFERGLMLAAPRASSRRRASSSSPTRERVTAPRGTRRKSCAAGWTPRPTRSTRIARCRLLRREDRCRGEPQQDLLVGARRPYARDRARIPGHRGRSPARSARGHRRRGLPDGWLFRCRDRSTPEPTRSSAT